MRPELGALLATVLLAGPVAAHPSVSLVMDSRGVVYYSDLSQVWMIQPDGSKRIAVGNVHTHELWIGAGDTLYGEDVQNIGDRVRHRVWKRAPDGTVTDVIGWREGYPMEHADYGFARDAEGRAYVLRRDVDRIDVRDADGRLVRSMPLDPAGREYGWLTVTRAGTVYLTIGPDLFRAGPGAADVALVATDLIERTEAFDWVHDRHALMGLWTREDPGSDDAGSPGDGDVVFVAVLAGQVVKRVGPGGTVAIVARSDGEWSPTGGLVAPDGALWLLEFSSSNEVRVRRIGEPVWSPAP